MNREKIVDYLDKQFYKHAELVWIVIKRKHLYNIVDGLIPLIKSELKAKKIKGICELCGGEVTYLEPDKCMTSGCPNCIF